MNEINGWTVRNVDGIPMASDLTDASKGYVKIVGGDLVLEGRRVPVEVVDALLRARSTDDGARR